jgi:hypothetical protein
MACYRGKLTFLLFRYQIFKSNEESLEKNINSLQPCGCGVEMYHTTSKQVDINTITAHRIFFANTDCPRGSTNTTIHIRWESDWTQCRVLVKKEFGKPFLWN